MKGSGNPQTPRARTNQAQHSQPNRPEKQACPALFRAGANQGAKVALLALALWLSLAAAIHGATFVVTNSADSGAGSFRQALEDANTNGGRDTITFAIPGGGVRTLSPLSPLPAITESVVIDGTSQPGYSGAPLVELTGVLAGTNAQGLYILADACEVRGLVLNRWSLDAVRLQGGYGSQVTGCHIGTDPTGRFSVGNKESGIIIAQSGGNIIGGTNAESRNVICRNKVGVYILGASSVGNQVLGNYIGVGVYGTNIIGNTNSGIIIDGASGNRIGGRVPGAGNVISGNDQAGVAVRSWDADGNVLEGNAIGTDASGRFDLGNLLDGVLVDGAPNTVIGGVLPGARNLISANKNRGIYIRGGGARDTVVQGNFIGTDGTGSNRLGNAFSGLGISSIPGNLIGGTNPAARNIISGNTQSGVTIEGSLASNNIVQGNFIGVDVSGQRALSNGFNGVTLGSAPLNVIGGRVPGAGNVIAGNGQNGIQIADARAQGNRIWGNLVGTDVTGTNALGNQLAGVRIESPGNFVGGTNSQARNIVSGNRQTGIFLLGATASNNVVQGNHCGVDISGLLRLGNFYAGVGISGAPRNQIGGAGPGMGNLISGNSDSGIYIYDLGGDRNVIQGNVIGPNITGTATLGNIRGGIYLYAVSNTVIGGTAPGAGNVIAGNNKVGIAIGDPGANNTVVQGNFLGVTQNGTTTLGNQWHNIEILNTASNNLIGGSAPGAGNRIANVLTALYAGIRVRDGCNGNVIQGNAIYGNALLGIDHGVNGVTLNDACDTDTGANNLQNYPILTSASGRYLTSIQGSLNTKAGGTYTLDFYGNKVADSSGNGEGLVWLGSRVVTTGGSCDVNFTVVLTNAAGTGPFMAATATDEFGNTSEFSPNVGVSMAADADGDGIPDDYELAHGLNPALNDAAGDADGDGVTNLQEFQAGTRPNDPASRLAVSVTKVDASTVYVGFGTVAGRIYRVESTPNLPGGWTPWLTGLAGTGQPMLFSAAVGPNGRFYRVLVEP